MTAAHVRVIRWALQDAINLHTDLAGITALLHEQTPTRRATIRQAKAYAARYRKMLIRLGGRDEGRPWD